MSVIVAAELRYGAHLRGSARLTQRVEDLLRAMDVLPFEPPADRQYARIRAALTGAGQMIGPNDLLIAAHAVALDATLVTANVAEFRRVTGLRIENWRD